jgi:flavin reductase ActVB
MADSAATSAQADFREAMAHFASGVTVVTTVDADGRPWGFTASAFSSLSLEPPLLLVCLDKGADSFVAFDAAEVMNVSILASDQLDVAMRFATRGVDKFEGTSTVAAETSGVPLIEGALSQVECVIHDRLDGGDHVILVGRVTLARTSEAAPLLHYDRRFGQFIPG